jgi:hypothetical protein
MSVPPPGGTGITIRTGRDGQACPELVERACAAASGANASAAAIMIIIRIFMHLLAPSFYPPHKPKAEGESRKEEVSP